MERNLRHIFLLDSQETEEFRTPRSGFRPGIPTRDRQSHSVKLQEQWKAIWAKAKEEAEDQAVVSMPARNGVYVEFEGSPGFDLATKSLEDRRANIRLLNVYSVKRPETNEEVVRATLFVPSGNQNRFMDKIIRYANEKTKKGNPKHAQLIESVNQVRFAFLEDLWADDKELIPGSEVPEWCEVWLMNPNDDEESDIEEDFRSLLNQMQIEVQDKSLDFPERIVLLIKATSEDLKRAPHKNLCAV